MDQPPGELPLGAPDRSGPDRATGGEARLRPAAVVALGLDDHRPFVAVPRADDVCAESAFPDIHDASVDRPAVASGELEVGFGNPREVYVKDRGIGGDKTLGSKHGQDRNTGSLPFLREVLEQVVAGPEVPVAFVEQHCDSHPLDPPPVPKGRKYMITETVAAASSAPLRTRSLTSDLEGRMLAP